MLYIKTPKGRYVPASVHDIACATLAMVDTSTHAGPCQHGIEGAATVKALAIATVGEYMNERECFGVVHLTTRNTVIKTEILFMGTIASCSVHPREIIKAALKVNAAAIAVFHNHPSGVIEPSTADIELTQRLVSVCREVDVRVLDHIIVGSSGALSFAERGLI